MRIACTSAFLIAASLVASAQTQKRPSGCTNAPCAFRSEPAGPRLSSRSTDYAGGLARLITERAGQPLERG